MHCTQPYCAKMQASNSVEKWEWIDRWIAGCRTPRGRRHVNQMTSGELKVSNSWPTFLRLFANPEGEVPCP